MRGEPEHKKNVHVVSVTLSGVTRRVVNIPHYCALIVVNGDICYAPVIWIDEELLWF